ncbi:MAG: hypothetical protein JST92_27380 [Deltaproteobacteria bacterium]|nr:hypothetical protein [Deltaproteobacteria bacterium]
MVSSNKLGFPILLGLVWAFMVVATLLGFEGFHSAQSQQTCVAQQRAPAAGGLRVTGVSVP